MAKKQKNPHKFEFRLEALKTYRKSRLAVARKEYLLVEAQLGNLVAQRIRALAARRESLGSDGKCTWSELSVNSQIVENESKRLALLEVSIREAEVLCEQHRTWLVHLGRELKVVERLEANQRAVFEQELKHKEKRREDGWVAERWSHNAQPTALTGDEP